MTRVVRAAGGVVARGGPGGVEVVLVHRPRYDDWTLPKGKLDPGEHPLLGAVREVWEETGVRAAPQLRLPGTRYLTGDPDVEKAVDYWTMVYRDSDPFVPGDEVDDLCWVPVGQAVRMLTYAHDRGVLADYPRLARVDGLVVLLRHAYAGERDAWDGDDDDRPLTAEGRATAEALARPLATYRPTRVISARPARCVQTVQPLAAIADLPIEVDDRFDEAADARRAVSVIRELAACDGVTVVCSQGGLIPDVVAALTGRGARSLDTPKGSAWVLGFAGTDFVAADRLDLEPASM
ncbi:NUDIX hydrolase [Planosporangium sp. 12N6]|uniref:NUDIX hydrolase n=1 Tax=Planosporangium spinosum TaxID=3402278 RepID=UPI003CF37B7F